MSTARRGGVDNVILLSGGAGDPEVLGGTADPSAGGGVAAPEGSLYLRYGAGAGLSYVKTGAANTAWILGGKAFGGDYQYAAQESRTSTTNDDTSPAVKTTLTTPALTGTYLVNWTATLDSANKIYECDLYNLTDTTILQFAKNKTAVDTYRWIEGGFVEVAFAGAAKTFQIRWYNENGASDTLFIQRARIALWRVS